MFKNAYLRANAAFVAVVVVGSWLWFEWDARASGFAGYLDGRAARGSGILSGAEWRAMRAAGDIATPAAGGAGCESEACRAAQAMLGGSWGGVAGCGSANVYRFTDSVAEVTSLKDGKPVEVVRRQYRIVQAPASVRVLRDGEGRPLDRSVLKQPGDVEVFTLGRSAYVRRILRAVDADTIRLVLVEQRTGRSGPPSAVVVDGRATVGDAPIGYRRCPAS